MTDYWVFEKKERKPHKYNRLHPEYPYWREDGFPDLVYDANTSVYLCFYCGGCKCIRCFNSGYLFLDPDTYHTLILSNYEQALFQS